MRRLILGTAGHIDHGKTALVRALTGTDTDRLPEEKRRGITIDLGFARLALPGDVEVGIVDVPGHEAFVRNMLAGATGMDVALLVVAADEGVMPQTREHAAILDLLGVRALVVALTKTDLVEPDWITLAADDVRALLDSGPFRDAVIVPVSARTGHGLDQLVHEIALATDRAARRSTGDLFRLPIDRIFTVHGTGTVVTGTVWSGSVARDQAVRLLPAGRDLRVRGLQSHGLERESVGAGERAAVAVAATARETLERGDTLATGEGWAPSTRLTLKLRALESSDPGIRHGQRVRFHLATSEVIGRIASAGTPAIAPGAEAWAQIRLDRPVVARAGDPFVIRSFSPVTTIGGGRVVEPGGPRRKRLTDTEQRSLALILGPSVKDAVSAATLLAGWSGLPVERIPVATPFSPGEIAEAVAADQVQRAGRLFHPTLVAEAERRLLEAVDGHHQAQPLSPGIRLESLRTLLPALAPPPLAEELIAQLLAAGTLAAEANRIRRAGIRPRLTPDQEAAARAILAEFNRAGLTPPLQRELPAGLASRADLEDLLHYLARAGDLVTFAPGWFISPSAIDGAAGLALDSFALRDNLTPADFRDLFGISRKYLIPLLEHFDRTGVTVRSGEGRRMASPASPGS